MSHEWVIGLAAFSAGSLFTVLLIDRLVVQPMSTLLMEYRLLCRQMDQTCRQLLENNDQLLGDNRRMAERLDRGYELEESVDDTD
jgi:hypothetical protein